MTSEKGKSAIPSPDVVEYVQLKYIQRANDLLQKLHDDGTAQEQRIEEIGAALQDPAYSADIMSRLRTERYELDMAHTDLFANRETQNELRTLIAIIEGFDRLLNDA